MTPASQITFLLPDELGAWIDEQVAAERDAEIYRGMEPVAWSKPDGDGRRFPVLD